MAYNKRNYFERIVEIQNITLEYKKKGVTQIWIYRNHIEKKYHICLRTYNAYLAINAKKSLQDLSKGIK